MGLRSFRSQPVSQRLRHFGVTLRGLPRRIIRKLRYRHSPYNPHRTFRLTPRRQEESTMRDVTAGFRLVLETFSFIRIHYRILLPLGLLYALLTAIIVGGVTQVDYGELRTSIEDTFDGKIDDATSLIAMFGTVTSALNQPASDIQRLFGGLLLIYFWLAAVWAVRRLVARKKFTLRDALYNSPGPIVVVILLMLIGTLQLIPALIGIFGYTLTIGAGWLEGGIESMILALAAILLIILSFYWLVSTVIAAIIATLPGIYPMRALREARDLVAGRRWRVLVRLLVLGVMVVLLWVVVLVPVLLLDGWLQLKYVPFVPVVIQLLAGLSLVFVTSYMYKLYRSLL